MDGASDSKIVTSFSHCFRQNQFYLRLEYFSKKDNVDITTMSHTFVVLMTRQIPS